MPTFRGYGGGRPARKNQLDMEPVSPREPIPLRVSCACGHRGRVIVPAERYYAEGFVLRAKCSECGNRIVR